RLDRLRVLALDRLEDLERYDALRADVLSTIYAGKPTFAQHIVETVLGLKLCARLRQIHARMIRDNWRATSRGRTKRSKQQSPPGVETTARYGSARNGLGRFPPTSR